MSDAWRTLRSAAAVTLSACYFLPLTQCSHSTVTAGRAGAADTVTVSWTDMGGLSSFEVLSADGLMVIALFFWPLALLLLRSRWPALARNGLVMALELLLLAAGAFLVYLFTAVGDRTAYGAYVFWAAAGAYAAAWFAEAYAEYRQRRATPATG